MLISKIIQKWYEGQIGTAEIQNTLCGGRNTENLIGSTSFYLKISRVNVFFEFQSSTNVLRWQSFKHSTRLYAIQGFPSFNLFDNCTGGN